MSEITTGIKIPELKAIVHGKIMSFSELEMLINDMLNLILIELMSDLYGWIETYVPEKSANLQFSIINVLETSEANDLNIIINLGSNLPYALAVNEMRTGQVRHFKVMSKDGILLDDPNAIGGWLDAYIVYANERFNTILQRNIDKNLKGLGVIMRSVRSKLS